MCLMLYIATSEPLEPGAYGKLTVEQVESTLLEGLRSVFSNPTIRFVGVDGGCSCDFRSIIADAPVGYFEGMFDHEDDEDRARRDTVAEQLMDLVRRWLSPGGCVELYPMWYSDRAKPPAGRTELSLRECEPTEFCFVEDWLYRVRA